MQDPSGMVYLRARYYSPLEGRFLSRDTWGGDANSRMSVNRWMYVEGNPTNLVDPTGHHSCSVDAGLKGLVDTAEKYLSRSNARGVIKDELNTYVAAGIAVQCTGLGNDWAAEFTGGGEGIAQVSDDQVNEIYEKVVKDGSKPRGCGLTKEGETIHDQNTPVWAVHYMRRRLEQVLNKCDKCTTTDRFIVAALAQNGPGFTHIQLTRDVLNTKPKNPSDLYRFLTPDGKVDGSHPDKVTVDWNRYFQVRNNGEDTFKMVSWFSVIVPELQSRNWYVPSDINWAYINAKLTQPNYIKELVP